MRAYNAKGVQLWFQANGLSPCPQLRTVPFGRATVWLAPVSWRLFFGLAHSFTHRVTHLGVTRLNTRHAQPSGKPVLIAAWRLLFDANVENPVLCRSL